jgi:KUP system potassium uptake protein
VEAPSPAAPADSSASQQSPVPPPPTHSPPSGATLGLALAALGVVFGDIGTSPLYTLRECINGEHKLSPTPDNILGVLSLIFWALMLVVTVKYMSFIMRADNRGEGGILALLALVPSKLKPKKAGHIGWVALLVIAGAALLYGDGIITPAISVLSAIEGLGVAAPRLKPVIIPLTCACLVGLFAIQKHGTERVGRLFGPIMTLWFLTIAALGSYRIVLHPHVLAALSPLWGVRFFAAHGVRGLSVLGSVVLAITGGEALYADMGHFGRRPIRISWLGLVLPALCLCYFGQGALVLGDPAAIDNPFYSLVPGGWWTYALVVLAALATIIASQALISGAFSLTHQAVQLGYFPRVTITHTSSETEGQIYVPEINWGLAIACIALVLVFKESSRLAAAYGIAVSGTMTITAIVFFVVMRETWKWPLWKALAVLVLFLSFDLPFLGANLLKFWDGGYFPLLVGLGFFLVMINWKKGRMYLAEYLSTKYPEWDGFIATLEQNVIARVPGAAVFLASSSTGVPPLLMHQVQRLHVLHETVLLVTVTIEHIPYLSPEERLEVVRLDKGFYRVLARYGFMETTNLPALLAEAIRVARLRVNLRKLTYLIGRETFLATEAGKMGRWSESLFAFLSRNARSASSYFHLPPEQVIEIGAQIDL